MKMQAAKTQTIHESGSEKYFPDHIFRVMLTYLQANPTICDRRSLGADNRNQTSDLKRNTPLNPCASSRCVRDIVQDPRTLSLMQFGDYES